MNIELGKLLIVVGLVIIAAGVAMMNIDKIPFLGRLPGDIHIERENFSFYFPLVSCLLMSAFISLLFWFFLKK